MTVSYRRYALQNTELSQLATTRGGRGCPVPVWCLSRKRLFGLWADGNFGTGERKETDMKYEREFGPMRRTLSR